MTVQDFLGSEQSTEFLSRYCRPATQEEVTTAGLDVDEILPEETYHVLVQSPSRAFTIPGFRNTYNIQSQWRRGQVIHPWSM